MSTRQIQSKAIPTSRIGRLTKLSGLVGRVAGSMLTEGSKQVLKGETPNASELLLTPKNFHRFAEHLAQMRGAAMKVGQLLSMDAGDLIPEELSSILSRLRAEGTSMPLNELNKLLEEDWGLNWKNQFSQFSFYPIAAASIGQVHEAHTQDGRYLALKIQYPGIRKTIDSDVDNLASLVRLSRVIPKNANLAPIFEEAKQQLHHEADYELESQFLNEYKTNLESDSRFLIPSVHEDLTTENILAMDFVKGVPIETIVSLSQSERDRVMTALFELLFREIFEFRLVQTDPNFANYLFNQDSQQIVLLDFGSTRSYSREISEGYRFLMSGALHRDMAKMEKAAEQIGFFQYKIAAEQRQAVLQLFVEACEPLYEDKPYDFANTDLASRIKEKGMALSFDLNYWHTPPIDAILFHRKLGGLYLLASKIRAKVNVHSLFNQYIVS